MIQIAGILGLSGAVFGGYVATGRHMGVILHALAGEMLIIGGGGLMTLLIANDGPVVMKVLKSMGAAFGGPRWKSKDYADLLCLNFLLLRTHQKRGRPKLERHIEKPMESPIFQRYPSIAKDDPLRNLICDTIRSITLNNKDSHRVGEMMETAIEKMAAEALKPAKALQTVSDAFPALGIVAAVLGVIKAMGAITEPPAVLGGMIGSALVGTFLGIFLSYGLFGPIAARIKGLREEERKIMDVTKAVITSYLENLSPQLCVEVGRQAIPSRLQPSYDQMDEHLRNAGRQKADADSGNNAEMRILTARLATLLALLLMAAPALAQRPHPAPPRPRPRHGSRRARLLSAPPGAATTAAWRLSSRAPCHPSEATRTPTGIDLHFRGRQPFNLEQFRPVTDIAGLTSRRDGQDSVLRVSLPCPCEVETLVEQRTLRLLVRRGAQPAAGAPVAAATPPASPPPASPAAAPAALVGAPAPAPAAAPAPVAGTEQAPPRVVRSARRPDHDRLAFDFPRSLPPHVVRNNGGETQIRFRGAYRLDLSQYRPLPGLSGLAIVADGTDSILRFSLEGSRVSAQETAPATLRLLLRRVPGAPPAPQAPPATAAAPSAQPAAQPATTPPAAAPPTLPARGGRQRPAQAAAPSAEEVGAMRDSILRQLGVLDGTIPAPAQPGGAQPAAGQQAGAAQPASGQQAAAANSAAANPAQSQQAAPGSQPASSPPSSTAPAGPAPAGSGSTIANAATPAAPPGPAGRTPPGRGHAAPGQTAQAPAGGGRTPPGRPACAPEFDPGRWGAGVAGDTHADRLTGLRRALAASGEGPEEAAALAEYLVSQGLLPEALDLLRDRIDTDLAEAARIRLQRVRDVARLLRRQRIEPSSPLLAESATCEREDLALWQALAAGAAGNTDAAAPLMTRAQRSLRTAPDALRLAMAFALAEAVPDNAEALRGLAATIRSANAATEAEEANRNWLMARAAGLSGAREEERQYLRRAAAAPRTVAGLFAAVRLAARDAERGAAGTATPETRRAEERLVDFARTYRHDMLGEEASILYAQLLLNRNDLSGALLAADAASLASTRPFLDSRGAAMAARVLRLLLVDPEGRTLPPPEERLAMFWGFEGYATPGERGDDIRLGAIRVMMQRDLPEPALEVARELAAPTLRTPAGALALARVEATAPEGDPQRALAILRDQPLGDDGKRAAALALARLNRPSDAADELAGLRETADLQNRGRYLFLAQRWTDAANTYAELLRDPALAAPQRTEATGRYATAAALSPQPVTRVPSELLSPADTGTRSLLMLQAHQPAGAPRRRARAIDLILNAIDRAKRIEAMASPEQR